MATITESFGATISNMLRDFMIAEKHNHGSFGHIDSFQAFSRLTSEQHVDLIDKKGRRW